MASWKWVLIYWNLLRDLILMVFLDSYALEWSGPSQNDIVVFSWDSHGDGMHCLCTNVVVRALAQNGEDVKTFLCFPQLEEVQDHIFSLLSVCNHKAMGKWVAYSSVNDTVFFWKRNKLKSWWSREIETERTCLCSQLLRLPIWQSEDLVSSLFSNKGTHYIKAESFLF